MAGQKKPQAKTQSRSQSGRPTHVLRIRYERKPNGALREVKRMEPPDG